MVSSMDSPSCLFEGTFRLDGQAAKVKKQDTVKVSLGYDDDKLTQIFEGKIDGVDIRTYDIYLTAFSSIFSLCTLRVDIGSNHRTAGQIVKNIASKGQVQFKEQDISDGVKFPYYVVDSNRNVYDHVQKLATTCGFDAYFTSEDKLVFKKYDPANKHKLTYGKNILSIRWIDNSNVVKSVIVMGESPASIKGAETFHWFKKEPVIAESVNPKSSEQGMSLKIINRAIKDDQTAKKVAEENLNTTKTQLTVMIEIVGDPTLLLGDAIVLEGVPNQNINGEYQIRTVEHSFSKTGGFVTSLKCRGETPE
jgi:phage protein D